MNERILHGKTPEERLAAVARQLVVNMQNSFDRRPDYADFRDTLRPFLQRELLLARVDEARASGAYAVTARVRELTKDLMKAEIACGDTLEEM